jgi:hypothetical protein
MYIALLNTWIENDCHKMMTLLINYKYMIDEKNSTDASTLQNT